MTKDIHTPGPDYDCQLYDDPRLITAERLDKEMQNNPPVSKHTPESGNIEPKDKPMSPQPQKSLKQADASPDALLAFSNMTSFEFAVRMARMLSSSTLVPKEYQGEQGISNAVIALEMSTRIGASPLAVMQNLYIVHGKPGWSAQFIIASLNSCGRYSPLRFTMGKDADGRNTACFASAIELATGEVLEGPEVTMAMAKMEGWLDKNGSKWKTMPDLMLRYRAASFFGKLYAPDILMGMQSADELHDIIEGVVDDGMTDADDLNAAIVGKK